MTSYISSTSLLMRLKKVLDIIWLDNSFIKSFAKDVKHYFNDYKHIKDSIIERLPIEEKGEVIDINRDGKSCDSLFYTINFWLNDKKCGHIVTGFITALVTNVSL